RFSEKLGGERLRQPAVRELAAEMQQREPTLAAIALPQEHPDSSTIGDAQSALKGEEVVDAVHERDGDEKSRQGGYRDCTKMHKCRGKEIGERTAQDHHDAAPGEVFGCGGVQLNGAIHDRARSSIERGPNRPVEQEWTDPQ